MPPSRVSVAENPAWFPGIEPKLGTYDALQRNNSLDVPRSLSLSLERNNSQRRVTNCAAWFGKEQDNHAKPKLRKKFWHCLLATLYPRTQPLHATRILSPTNTRSPALLLGSGSHFSWLAPSRQRFVSDCHACALVLLLSSDNRFGWHTLCRHCSRHSNCAFPPADTPVFTN